MDLFGGIKSENNFSGHKLNESNYRLWKFQMNAYMKSQELTDNIEGKVPAESATAEIKAKYDRNEGKAMNALIQSLDVERASHILTCTTAKQMVDKLSSIFEKNSEIRVMNLYEEYFAIKMKEDDTVAGYISKVNTLASEIEAQGEKLSNKLKMVRIISSLLPKFNNYKTVWYNTKETRSIDTLMSSLQLEEDNLNKNCNDENEKMNVAFAAKSKYKHKQNTKVSLSELKRKTKCNICHQTGHWARECPQNKIKIKQDKSEKSKKEVGFWANAFEVENNKDDIWIADSGASSHMTFQIEWFSQFKEYTDKKVVQIANNECLAIRGVGSILIEAKVDGKWEPRRLENVLYVPDLKQNLFSTAAVTSKNFNMVITKDGCELLNKENKILATGFKDELNQLKMNFRRRIDEHANTAAASLQQWHCRLGHINTETIKKMCNKNLVDGVKLSNNNTFFCDDCQLGKMVRVSHKSVPVRPSEKGQYLHVDLCGPMEENGINNVRYFLLIKDEATSFRYVYFLNSKNEVYINLKSFIPLVHNTIGKRIKNIRFDNGSEFVNQDIKNILLKEGITWERISPYTPEQNGRIERDNRTVQESARTMLIASGLEKCLWPEAVRTAVYMLNRSTNSKRVDSTPYQEWFGKKPELGHIRIFGTECFVQIPKQIGRKKWDPKAKKVFLVGFEPTSKNFRLYDPNNKKIIISCNVRFNEKEKRIMFFPNDDKNNKKIDIDSDDADSNDERDQKQDSFDSCCSDVDDKLIQENIEKQNEVIDDNEKYNLRPRTKGPDRLIETGYSAVVLEPTTYEEALNSSECKNWEKAINEELNSLVINNTWEIIKKPNNVNVVGCKWVFKLKPSLNGSKYKARLVAKGFSQREGIDFGETFSPVVRYDSIRTVLSIAAIEDWEIAQFDVKTAFLNGDLDEIIYMETPKGIETQNTNMVCRLKKSLYGLKQASRVWNLKFTNFLKDFNMLQSEADKCVFRGNVNGQTVILLLYVDDGLVLSSSKDSLKKVIDHLSNNFNITTGSDNCYVGVEFKRDRVNKKIFINQKNYINKLINKFNMSECKTASTPADCNVILQKNQEEEKINFPYRQAVGSLMFASIVSRPDISYSVGAVSRYLENPGSTHVNAVKRIIRYLKGTNNYGIEYGGTSVVLKGYTDSDHGRDIDTRRSTSGYAFLINNGIVSWKSYLQKTVALSTTEAEYIAASDGVKEAIWLRQLLKDIGFEEKEATSIMIDNQSAIILTKNAELHQRTKYIDVRFHFIRDYVNNGMIKPIYIATEDQIADALTKPIPTRKFHENIMLFGIKNLQNN